MPTSRCRLQRRTGRSAPVHVSAALIFYTFLLLPTAVREAERPIVLPIALAVFVCAPLGTWILVSVDAAVMKIVIGLLVTFLVVLVGKGWRLRADVPIWVLLGAGSAGGLVQGSAGIGGPPVVAIALSRPGPPEKQRANVLGVMTAIAFSSVFPLAYFGLFTIEALVLGLMLMPLYSGSTWVGARYFSTGGRRYFRVAALALLACIGLATLAISLRDYVLQG